MVFYTLYLIVLSISLGKFIVDLDNSGMVGIYNTYCVKHILPVVA